MEFHEKLQELRKKKGLTQEELAEALFVSRTAVSKWEQGRGYPSIDSLKAISKFYGVTIDELLSGGELLTIAEEETKGKENHFRDLVFGLLDCGVVMFFFLPFFAERAGESVTAVSLLGLSGISYWLKLVYISATVGIVVWGVMEFALQNCRRTFWLKYKWCVSLVLNITLLLLLILGRQPYGAVLLLLFLGIKSLVHGKKP